MDVFQRMAKGCSQGSWVLGLESESRRQARRLVLDRVRLPLKVLVRRLYRCIDWLMSDLSAYQILTLTADQSFSQSAQLCQYATVVTVLSSRYHGRSVGGDQYNPFAPYLLSILRPYRRGYRFRCVKKRHCAGLPALSLHLQYSYISFKPSFPPKHVSASSLAQGLNSSAYED